MLESRINAILLPIKLCKNKQLIPLNSRHLPKMKTLLSNIATTYMLADYQDSPSNLSFCKLSIQQFAMSKKLG